MKLTLNYAILASMKIKYKNTECLIVGCRSKKHSKGLCKNHYIKFWKWGSATKDFRKPNHVDPFDWYSKPENHTVNAYGCWIPKGKSRKNRYVHVHQDLKERGLHTISVERKYGRRLLAGEVTRHRCKPVPNKSCFNPDHLLIGPYTENAMDLIKDNNGHPNSILTHNDVRRIRYCWSYYLHSREELADMFCVSFSTISKVVYGDNFKYV